MEEYLLEINVKTVSNESYVLQDISCNTLIAELKSQIASRSDVEVARQRLIYRGQVLDDSKSLENYHMENGHTIHMVARPLNIPASPPQVMTPTPETRSTTPRTPGAALRRMLGSNQIPLGLFNPLLPMPGIHRNTNAEIVVDTSLEPLRQNILTVNTLMTTLSDLSSNTVTSSSGESKVSEGDEREMEAKVRRVGSVTDGEKQFFVGQWIDVKDTVNQWLAATIMDIDIDSRKLFIHFNGWPVRWDEWIDWNSPRICPFRSHTSHDTTSHSSPALTTREASTLSTGRDDIRILLPEVHAIMQSLSPLMQSLGELSSGSLVTYSPELLASASATQHSLPWMQYQQQPNSEDPHDAQDETALRSLAAELSPLVDRVGRLLVDLAPHLRLLANAPIPPSAAPPTEPSTNLNQSEIDGYRRVIAGNSRGPSGTGGGFLDIHVHAILATQSLISGNGNNANNTAAPAQPEL